MKKEYNIFLDDERNPEDVTWIVYPNGIVWDAICRNYDQFVQTIEKNGVPAICSLDHDLGMTAYREFFRANAFDKKINYDRILEKTGMDCARFLANYCVDRNLPLPVYYLHSMNPMGCENMKSVLDSAKKVIEAS